MGWTFYTSSGQQLRKSGPSQADQTALEAETNEDTYAPPDLIKHSPGVAKVWVKWNHNGTGAHSIVGSYNMTSVTDGSGVGDTDHLWDTDFSGTVYALVASGGSDTIITATNTFATTGVTTITRTSSTGAAIDEDRNNIACFGDQ